MTSMRSPTDSPLRLQAADILRRARKLPVGPHRNDLRQLASGLLNIHRLKLNANAPADAAQDLGRSHEHR